jgi:hypothetical protein
MTAAVAKHARYLELMTLLRRPGGTALTVRVQCENRERPGSTRIARRSIGNPKPARVKELWTGEDLGKSEGRVLLTIGPHDGRVLVCA